MSNQISRLLALIAFAVMACTLTLRAQTNGDEYDFSDIPVDEEELPYIGVGAGYNGFVTLMNFDELNTLARSYGLPDFDGLLWMHGGGGWTAIGIIPNIRLGVYGAAGSKDVTRSGDTLTGGTLNRQARMTRSHVFLYPVLNVEWALTQFVMVRLGGGYNISFLPSDWTDDEGTAISNVPDIDAHGVTINFGVYLGLFQQ